MFLILNLKNCSKTHFLNFFKKNLWLILLNFYFLFTKLAYSIDFVIFKIFYRRKRTILFPFSLSFSRSAVPNVFRIALNQKFGFVVDWLYAHFEYFQNYKKKNPSGSKSSAYSKLLQRIFFLIWQIFGKFVFFYYFLNLYFTGLNFFFLNFKISGIWKIAQKHIFSKNLCRIFNICKI
jgi:hypothetical protein